MNFIVCCMNGDGRAKCKGGGHKRSPTVKSNVMRSFSRTMHALQLFWPLQWTVVLCKLQSLATAWKRGGVGYCEYDLTAGEVYLEDADGTRAPRYLK